ncbi:uncharacterized protein LOC107368742 [Tetranychus urticae]|uniref:DUF19 domain-containing protein n=1 Tax=Tetranychus urticae TaxID=32264 RepID=T1KZ84_TETUR|nr:uncharacterized protein LOC107368742 [Tetranychus urticae]
MKLQLVLLLPLVFAFADAQDQCKAIARRFDRSFRSFFFIGETIKIPVNKPELAEHCKLPQRAVKSLKKYKELCTRGLSNQILQLAVTGITNAIQSMCSSESQERTLEVNRCLSNDSIKSFHDCFYRGERMLDTVSKWANNTNILPLTCCAFNFFDECVFTSIDKICPSSNIKINDYFQKFFDLALDDVRDLACGRLKTITKCEESHPRQTRRLRRIYQSKDTDENKRGSFIFSLVEISSKLSE